MPWLLTGMLGKQKTLEEASPLPPKDFLLGNHDFTEVCLGKVPWLLV